MAKLTPVDYDPFKGSEIKLTAVDYDPFSNEPAAPESEPETEWRGRNQRPTSRPAQRQSDIFYDLPDDVIEKIKKDNIRTGRGSAGNENRMAKAADFERFRLQNPVMAQEIESMDPFTAFRIGAGSGFYSLARGVGLTDQPEGVVKESIDALENRHGAAQVGKLIAQAAPFLIPGGAAGNIASTPLRIAAMGATGAAEGGIVAKGEGGTTEDVVAGTSLGLLFGAGGEVLLPYLNRLGRRAIKNVRGESATIDPFTPDGKPTEEFIKSLDDAGISYGEFIEAAKQEGIPEVSKSAAEKAGLNWSQLNDDLKERINRQIRDAIEIGSDLPPEALARKAVYESQGITPTRAIITRNFEDTLNEQNLLGMPEGQQVRDIYNRNNQQIRENIQAMAPEGYSATDAPTFGNQFRKPIQQAEKRTQEVLNTIYGAAKIAEGGRSASAEPLVDYLQNNLTMLRVTDSAKPVIQYMKDMKVLPRDIDVLDKAAIGESISLDKIKLSEVSGLRRIVNQAWQGAKKKGDSVAENQLNDMRQVLNGMEESAGGDLYNIYRKARRQKGETFEDNPLVDKLLSDKKGYYGTDFIEDSEVFQKVVMSSTPEQFGRVYRLLDDDGKKLTQAQVAKYIEDEVFSNQSMNDVGEIVGSSAKLTRTIRKIGDSKLKIIFGKEGADNILNLAKTVREISNPPRGTVPQGSAPRLEYMRRSLMSSLSRISSIPGVGMIAESFLSALENGAKSRASKKASSEALDIMSKTKRKTQSALDKAEYLKSRNSRKTLYGGLPLPLAGTSAAADGGDE